MEVFSPSAPVPPAAASAFPGIVPVEPASPADAGRSAFLVAVSFCLKVFGGLSGAVAVICGYLIHRLLHAETGGEGLGVVIMIVGVVMVSCAVICGLCLLLIRVVRILKDRRRIATLRAQELTP